MATFQQDQEVAKWFIFSVSQAAVAVSAKWPSYWLVHEVAFSNMKKSYNDKISINFYSL